MSQFYIQDEESVKKCRDSYKHRDPVTVSGVDAIDNRVKLYTGVVQSVEDHGAASPSGRRWRATMQESN
jgi:hypothetical protein